MKRDMNRTGRYGAKSGLNMVGRTVSAKIGRLTDGKHDGDTFKTVRKNGSTKIKVYIGPSVEGSDKKYVKVLSGNVDRRKPSFA
ncbi:hypothetical protein M5X11_16005 [Paenibacillus alginolyticus]|uniref:hypothetical protein n=1 Tax=Paenibacillus alginolyticus TaxID=59839 RepID=UPI000420761F|nr:hypothetical protein [Paenibacillus alginolyticus]MCY9666448.1 hypothetical protein [Paenibacillus alginolyticus]